jgi:phosphatidylglycerophosphatase A
MKRLLTSCFGIGWLPLAPGTWGSLPPAIIFGLLCNLGISTASAAAVMAVLALAASVVCVKFAPAIIAATGKSDPKEIVADELAGQAITFLPTGSRLITEFPTIEIWIVVAFGFVLFRIFDITKPWPIRKLEKLPGGWGILTDDLMAGVFAAIVMQIIFFVLPIK